MLPLKMWSQRGLVTVGRKHPVTEGSVPKEQRSLALHRLDFPTYCTGIYQYKNTQIIPSGRTQKGHILTL